MSSSEKMKSQSELQVSYPEVADEQGYHSEKNQGPEPVTDEVFGDVSGADRVHYRSMGFWGTTMVMVKTQIGLGVLSMPFLFQVVGMVPGVILFLVISVAVTWCSLIIGSIKARYPQVYNIDDLGFIMGGKIGREYFAIAMIIYLVTCSSSGMISLSIALNALSLHGACTAIFMLVAAVMVGCVASIHTLSKLSYVAWLGVFSIFTAVFTIMIAVGVQDRPALAPQTGPWDKDITVFGSPTFAAASSTLGGMVFTVACTPAFFSIYGEMRDPRLYNRCVYIAQILITLMDTIVGIVVYYYCGQYVASPSPGSAGPLMKRVCYGLAFPGVLVSATVFTHYAAKYIFVRIFRNSPHLSTNNWKHWVAWLSCTIGCTIIAYIVGSGIPIFSSLSSLIGSFFGPVISLQPMGMIWIFMNWNRRKTDSSLKYRVSLLWAIFVTFLGFFLQVTGTYGSIVDIINGFKSGAINKPWSCADNSHSV